LFGKVNNIGFCNSFVELDEPEGKKKQPTIIVNENDRELVALTGLFNLA